jgi:hypothetical protein
MKMKIKDKRKKTKELIRIPPLCGREGVGQKELKKLKS